MQENFTSALTNTPPAPARIFEVKIEARRLLVKLAIQSSSSNKMPELNMPLPVMQLDPATLTHLSVRQFRVASGNWVLAGFDHAGHTDIRLMISVDGEASMIFTGNQASNCNEGFSSGFLKIRPKPSARNV